MGRTIVLVLDGLRYDVMRSSMGYLNHLIEKGQAAAYKVKSELPSLSRPLYEVLLTGTPAYVNGIVSNAVARLSNQDSLFHLARKQGLTTAAAAYHWVSELYQKAPFEYADRIQLNTDRPIQHGMFYFDDRYPDSHLIADAEFLRTSFDPDFLYIHTMNVDDAGHKFTSDSAEYRGEALRLDGTLAMVLPAWIAAGYNIVITADHGMNADGHHGGTGEAERDVGLIGIGEAFIPGEYTDQYVPQLAVAPLICRLLDIPRSPAMANVSFPGLKAEAAVK